MFILLLLFSRQEEESEHVVPRNRSLYVVFESALLSLFTYCLFCGSSSTKISKKVIGSFLRIVQTCCHCGKKRHWESQPYVGTIPAGNILMSSAILFSGSVPHKSLRIFKYIGIACISISTFFRHQRKYLENAVANVWKEEQAKLFQVIKEKGGTPAVAGDGRCDSPGHSAKFGSYTLLELNLNKILDFQLVQVLSAVLIFICLFI